MSRYVLVDNQSTNPINVYVTPNNSSMYKLGTLQPNHAIRWYIPAGGWSGNFRVNTSANATLAEFTFDGYASLDYYDISAIPPGCPGYATSYAQCKQITGLSGWNFPVTIRPVGGTGPTITCQRPGCPEGFGFPADNSKTQTSADTTPWYHVIFGAGIPANHYHRHVRTFPYAF